MVHGYRQLYSLYKNRRHYTDTTKDIEARFDTPNCKLTDHYLKEKIYKQLD